MVNTLATAVALLLCAAPLAAAQEAGKVWRIGFLTPGGCPNESSVAGLMLVEGLRDRGHVVGKTMVFECRRSDEGREERFRELADELVRLKVDLIIGISSAATRALRPTTKTIPIVVLDLETDPVGGGLAASLASQVGTSRACSSTRPR
jgi:putative ABC transport system substrate-binding protein